MPSEASSCSKWLHFDHLTLIDVLSLLTSSFFLNIKYGNFFGYINALQSLHLHHSILYVHHVTKELFNSELFIFIFWHNELLHNKQLIIIYCCDVTTASSTSNGVKGPTLFPTSTWAPRTSRALSSKGPSSQWGFLPQKWPPSAFLFSSPLSSAMPRSVASISEDAWPAASTSSLSSS